VRIAGSPESVVEAVRDEAAAELEALDRATREQIARLETEAGDELAEDPRVGVRLASARREAAETLSREDLADRRETLQERERWIARAAAEGAARLARSAEPGARRELLARLAVEAIEALPGDAFEVRVSPEDAAVCDEAWRQRVGGPSRSVTVRTDGFPEGGGCSVRTRDGRVSFDNGFAARARRFEAAWRAELARIFPA
jgi:vacuolar-type H+-ATPase subunit E/Vma4